MKISFGVTFLPSSLSLPQCTYARVCVRCAATPWLAGVIRGLLTRRVAPAPARRSLTLEIRELLMRLTVTRRPASRGPVLLSGGCLPRRRKDSTVRSRLPPQARASPCRKGEKSRPTSRTILASLTHDPALARVATEPGRTAYVAVWRISAPRRSPVSRAVEEPSPEAARARKRDRHHASSSHVLTRREASRQATKA